MPRSNLHPQGPPDYEFLPDWYGVLELTKEASASAIRTAYKRLAFQYHPDKTLDEKLKPEMTKRFTQIQEAYEVLSDSRRRREYDEDLTLEGKILEDWRRTQDVRERAARTRKAQTRHQEEERIRRAEDRQAEKDYLAAKKQEEDQLFAAMQAQSARKQHAADQERRKTTSQDTDRQNVDRQRRKEEERRQRRMKEDDMYRREAERKDAEKLQREDDQKRFARDHEKRTRDRRHERGHKVDMMQQFPIDDILDAEPAHFGAAAGDRGRSSKERLRDPTLHVPGEKPRDRSRQRNGSRHREQDRESEFTTRDFEHSRKHRFYAEAGGRRMSTEPIHEDYMRTTTSSLYGSPPHPYSVPRSAASYSPPPSPRMRHSNPTMNTTHNFQGPNKGRDRTRDRPGERPRKHSEAGLYSRDSFPSVIPEDVNSSLPGNRDSGYSTSSAGTTVHPGTGPENLDPAAYGMNGKKYKAKVMYVTDSEEEDGASTIGRTRTSKRATKQSSRDDPLSAYAPRHQPTVELDDDPFLYMQTGSKTFPFTHKDVNYGAKLSQVHTRTNSDQSAPGIQIDFINEGMAGMGMGPPGHKSRHAPTVGGSGGLPTFSRHQTWAT
ncbi:DnaJ (Hsp40), sub C, member 11 [Orbilia oligospora]|nr:DnaJ (Hsp40), sub C, member 11 [Orbilia oligospora]